MAPMTTPALIDAGGRTIAHDCRGHGRSAKKFGKGRETLARVVPELVDPLNLRDGILFGSSPELASRERTRRGDPPGIALVVLALHRRR